MAVVTSSDYEEQSHRTAEVCAVCKKPPSSYPYLLWATDRDFVLCGACCHELKRGLIADLIHIGAIMDMRAHGYRHFTLEKKLMPSVTAGNPIRRAPVLRRVARGEEA